MKVESSTIQNKFLRVQTLNYGASLFEVYHKKKKINLILNLGSKQNYRYKHPSVGSTCGRYAGRISNAKFKIGNKKYNLNANEGKNILHGGKVGFSILPWKKLNQTKDKIVYQLHSANDDQGFPGDLVVNCTYQLINNAANDDRHTTDQVDEKYWENRMAINLKHYFFAAKAVVKSMKKMKAGSIVNLSSVSWMLGEGDKVVYETAKSAVVGLTRSFAQEYGKYNIRTNSVVPGSIATERQIKHWLTPKYKKLILDSQALKRQLKPNDVAQMVMFLASDQSSGCTKQSFIVDGGIT